MVGVIEPCGAARRLYGKLAKDDKRPLNGDTVFEIGSITKVFTSLVLADAVGRGEVALTDPVAKFLPGGESARAKRPQNYAAGSFDAELRSAADADEFRSEGSAESLRRLLGRTSTSFSAAIS